MSFSIVIPSANADNLVPCVNAILSNEPLLSPSQIIVIDDGAKEGAIRKLPIGIRWVTGIKPFVFARNCNLGFDAAHQNDVILLNDDAILKTPNGFTKLARMVQNYGIVSAITNSAGNPNQYRRSPIEESIRFDVNIAFVCVGISRGVYNTLGRLDERFVEYGWDDTDYCKRAVNAGLKIAIYDGCFVDHLSLTSTFRGPNGAAGSIEPGRLIFEDKWGKS